VAEDGGTMGVAWYKQSDNRPTNQRHKPQPILLLFPGLGGGHNNMYTHAIAE